MNTHLLQGRVIIFNIIGAYAVLLTFGLNYPPLAVVIALAVISLTAGWQIIIQQHISDLYDIPNNEVDIEAVRARLEHDCRRLWKVFTRSSSLLLFSCSFFYGLYFLDTVPGTYYFGFIAIGVPACWHVLKVTMKTFNKNLYKEASKKVVSTIDVAVSGVRKIGGNKYRHSVGGSGHSIMLVDINNPIVNDDDDNRSDRGSSIGYSSSTRGSSSDNNNSSNNGDVVISNPMFQLQSQHQSNDISSGNNHIGSNINIGNENGGSVVVDETGINKNCSI